MNKIIKVKNWTDTPENATGIFEDTYGNKLWYLNGKLHRVDGPAVEYSNGSKFWFLNGKEHRVEGPDVKYSSGSKYWYLNGVSLTEAEHEIKSRKYTTKVGRLLYKEET